MHTCQRSIFLAVTCTGMNPMAAYTPLTLKTRFFKTSINYCFTDFGTVAALLDLLLHFFLDLLHKKNLSLHNWVKILIVSIG